MGNWNSHPDQTIDREPPPIQFQDQEAAEKYYPDINHWNDYGWVYILAGVVILFVVMGCCVCLCKIGAKDAQPAAATGYQPVPQAVVVQGQQPNAMYDALPEQMPASFMAKGKKPKKQPSMIYPTMSPAPSMHGHPSMFSPMYQPPPGYMPQYGQYPGYHPQQGNPYLQRQETYQPVKSVPKEKTPEKELQE